MRIVSKNLDRPLERQTDRKGDSETLVLEDRMRVRERQIKKMREREQERERERREREKEGERERGRRREIQRDRRTENCF